MSPISNALDYIKNNIPREVLDLVFDNRDWVNKRLPISVDEQIKVKVLLARVLPNCSMMGGRETKIDLSDVPMQQTNDYTYVVRIPKSKTQNSTIISVRNLTFADPYSISNFGVANLTNNSQLLNTGMALVDQHGSIPNASAGNCQIIGDNVIVISEMYLVPSNCYMRVILENDSNLSNLQLRSYQKFAKGCLLATKAYIFNNYEIKLDMGELRGGQTLGSIKTVIERYADANELYDEWLEKDWPAISVMNDNETWERMVRSRVGGNR